MKILQYMLVTLVFIFGMGVIQTSALYVEPTKYSTMEAFEKAEGLTCQSATDGCNTYFMTEDGKVGGGTLMYCEDIYGENGQEAWSCTQKKDDGMVHITTDVMVGNDTDSHGCIGSAGFAWSESKNMCMRSWEEKLLSDNDWGFYNSIEKQLSNTQKEKVSTITTKLSNLLEKFSEKKQERLKTRLATLIEAKISALLLKYPQDIALPAKADTVYKTLSYLKFQVILGR